MSNNIPRRVIVGADGRVTAEADGDNPVLAAGETLGFGTGAVGQPLMWYIQPTEYAGTMGIPVFDVRNGNIEDACSLLVQAAIPLTFHWPIISQMLPERAMECVDVFIKAAMVQYDTALPPGAPEGYRRRTAIVLGVMRAAMCAYYRITDTDLIPGERGMTVAAMAVPVPAGQAPSFAVAPELNQAQRAIMTDPLVLDDSEKAVINALVRCGVAVPALQGYSLVMCGHHYLSEEKSQSRRAVLPVEKQMWSGQGVNTWFTTDVERTRDLVWHKSAHPLLMSLKMEIAKSSKTKEMLKLADIGSAGARLPAEESELRAAGSYLALMDTLKPVLEGYGGGINTAPLEEAMEKVRASEGVRPTAQEASQGVTAASIRRGAIADLKNLIERGSGTAAWCYGFYTRMLERDAVEAGRGITDTLRVSYALSKLPSNSTGSFHVGKLHHAAFEAAMNRARKTGLYDAPYMTFGTTPPPALAGGQAADN